jgi:hypothetical protein
VHYYTTQTYVQASNKLDDACDWLQSIGVEYSRTRVGRYKSILNCLAKLQEAGKLDDVFIDHSFEEWVNATHEVAELERIYEGLGGNNDQDLSSRLSEAIKGHELYVLDSGDRSGRDFGFELSIAAKFSRAGFLVDFGHDADIKVEIDGAEFFVECKRLKSEKKVNKRIKEGLKQLHKRYKKSPQPDSSRGILAISIGKILNGNLGLIEGKDSNEVGLKAFSHNRKFINRYGNLWHKTNDKRTLGVVIVQDSPAILTTNNQLVTCHEVTANNCIPETNPDYLRFLGLVSDVFPKRT